MQREDHMNEKQEINRKKNRLTGNPYIGMVKKILSNL